MKTAILTFLHACNYGAVLQCFALNKAIARMGGAPVTIDYWPDLYRKRYYIDTLPPHPSFLPSLRHPRRWWRAWKQWRQTKAYKKLSDIRNLSFERFIARHIPHTQTTYRTLLDISAETWDIPVWITGSDQVWCPDNCAFADPVFFLDFPLPAEARRYSYAASFGVRNLATEHKEEYKRRLAPFCERSVREESGAAILRELGFETAHVHCDPTLLLAQEDWNAIASPARPKPYILIYYVTTPDSLFPIVEQLRRETGAEIVALSTYQDAAIRHLKNCRVLTESSPEEFISLFRHADYVLTNSFHGTVFSTIYHKPFLTDTEATGKPNTRILNLLEKLQLTERTLCRGTDIHTAIDWENVRQKAEQLRRPALEYLRRITVGN